MKKYIKIHEAYVLSQYNLKENRGDLLEYHKQQIVWLQHERLVHLLVMIFTCSIFIASFIGFLFNPQVLLFVLVILLGALTFAYILHYYRLENTVQKWYRIANTIHFAQTSIGTNLYD